MSGLVTIFGGSGFVGRHIASTLAQQGWRVRVAVRRPDLALFVRTYGVVGQVEPIACNIRDDQSVRRAMIGADAVVNCVGIMVRQRGNTFDAVQVEGAGRVARLATEAGVARLVHISAIGADSESASHYAATKGRGEAAVLYAFPDAVILRPSVIFGMGDNFYNKLAGIATMSPVVPVVGARSRVQPVHVGDVAKAAAMAAQSEVAPGIYELGGPDIMTMREINRQILDAIGRRRLVIAMPRWIARILATMLDVVQFVTAGLITNSVLTRDQVRLLAQDNVVAEGAKGLEAFGIEPISTHGLIEDYLWRFRNSGEYAEMNRSALDLRQDG